jgi:prepilin-type N-terminal cleavage/methylation domain-containing protein
VFPHGRAANRSPTDKNWYFRITGFATSTDLREQQVKVMNTNLHQVPKIGAPRGFSLIEVLFVVARVGVVTAFAVIGVSRARTDTQLSNAAQTFKTFVEKGVADARRRHAKGGDRAKVEVLNATSYRVTEDFDLDGNLETRTVNLPTGVRFVYVTTPPTVTIDLHGNVIEGQVVVTMTNSTGRTSSITVSRVGDASRGDAPDMPSVSGTPNSDDIRLTSAYPGNTQPNLDPSPTATLTPLPQCVTPSQPINAACRCRTGQTIDSSGKCH